MAVKIYTKSNDGIGTQFTSNHVGHFLLTKLLIDEKVDSKGAMIVKVTSLGYQLTEINLEDPKFGDRKAYNPWNTYGQAKTADILFSVALGQKLGKKRVAVFAVHPGRESLDVTLVAQAMILVGIYLAFMESQLFSHSNVTEGVLMEEFKMAVAGNDGNPLPPQANATLS